MRHLPVKFLKILKVTCIFDEIPKVLDGVAQQEWLKVPCDHRSKLIVKRWPIVRGVRRQHITVGIAYGERPQVREYLFEGVWWAHHEAWIDWDLVDLQRTNGFWKNTREEIFKCAATKWNRYKRCVYSSGRTHRRIMVPLSRKYRGQHWFLARLMLKC